MILTRVIVLLKFYSVYRPGYTAAYPVVRLTLTYAHTSHLRSPIVLATCLLLFPPFLPDPDLGSWLDQALQPSGKPENVGFTCPSVTLLDSKQPHLSSSSSSHSSASYTLEQLQSLLASSHSECTDGGRKQTRFADMTSWFRSAFPVEAYYAFGKE